MTEERISAHLARLEERIVALDQKVEINHNRNTEQRQSIQTELARVHSLLVLSLKEHTKEITKLRDDTNTIKRDRVWFTSLFGLFWALLLIYVESKFKG